MDGEEGGGEGRWEVGECEGVEGGNRLALEEWRMGFW